METLEASKKEKQLLARENHSRIASCRTNILAIFRCISIYGNFRGVSEYLFYYSTVSRGTVVNKRRSRLCLIRELPASDMQIPLIWKATRIL